MSDGAGGSMQWHKIARHKKSRLKLVAIKSYNKIIIVLQFEETEVCFQTFLPPLF